MDNNKKRKVWRIILLSFCIIIFLFCSLTVIYAYNLYSPSINNGQKKAEPIIQAIYDYQQVQEHYPESLDDLVPTYFKKVPKPDLLNYYSFHLCKNQTSFTLSFVPKGEFVGDGNNAYCSTTKQWHRTDSAYSGDCNSYVFCD